MIFFSITILVLLLIALTVGMVFLTVSLKERGEKDDMGLIFFCMVVYFLIVCSIVYYIIKWGQPLV